MNEYTLIGRRITMPVKGEIVEIRESDGFYGIAGDDDIPSESDGSLGIAHYAPNDCQLEKEVTHEELVALDKADEEKIIWVIRLEFYDGSKFYIRTDSIGWQDLIDQKKREKGKAFMELPTVRQIKLKDESIKRIGSLVRMTQMRVTEAEYLRGVLLV